MCAYVYHRNRESYHRNAGKEHIGGSRVRIIESGVQEEVSSTLVRHMHLEIRGACKHELLGWHPMPFCLLPGAHTGAPHVAHGGGKQVLVSKRQC